MQPVEDNYLVAIPVPMERSPNVSAALFSVATLELVAVSRTMLLSYNVPQGLLRDS
jgi:hypothetical protein